MSWIVDGLYAVLDYIMIWVNDLIFSLAGGLFEIFFAFVDLRVMNAIPELNYIIDRIMVLTGVFMLFKLSFSFLTYLVSPDKMTDSGNGATVIVRNVVIVVIALATLSWGFQLLYELEGAIVEQNVIPRLIMGVEDASIDSFNSEDISIGQQMTYMIWVSFFAVPDPEDSENTISCLSEAAETNTNCDNAKDAVATSVLGGFTAGKYIDIAGVDELKTNSIISLIAGIILVFMLISFIIDIGVRAFKLAFLQMIAPIPIISYIDPNGQKAFKNWLTVLGTTFLELFLRIAVILLAMVLISNLTDVMNSIQAFSNLSGISWAVAYFLLILSILSFAKMVPKLFQDIFNIQFGDTSINPLKKAGFGRLTSMLFTGAALTGGGAILGYKAGGISGAIKGGLSGGARGMYYGAMSPTNKAGDYAKNFKTAWEKNKSAGVRKAEEGGIRQRMANKFRNETSAVRSAALKKAHDVTSKINKAAGAVRTSAQKAAEKNLSARIGGRKVVGGRDGYVSARTETQSEALRIARQKLAQYNAAQMQSAQNNASERQRLQQEYDAKMATLTNEQREAYEKGMYEGAPNPYENAVDAANMYTQTESGVSGTYAELDEIKREQEKLEKEAADNNYDGLLNEYQRDYANVETSERELANAQEEAGREYDTEEKSILSQIQNGDQSGLSSEDYSNIREEYDKLQELQEQNNSLDDEFRVDLNDDIVDIEKNSAKKTRQIENNGLWKE